MSFCCQFLLSHAQDDPWLFEATQLTRYPGYVNTKHFEPLSPDIKRNPNDTLVRKLDLVIF